MKYFWIYSLILGNLAVRQSTGCFPTCSWFFQRFKIGNEDEGNAIIGGVIADDASFDDSTYGTTEETKNEAQNDPITKEPETFQEQLQTKQVEKSIDLSEDREYISDNYVTEPVNESPEDNPEDICSGHGESHYGPSGSTNIYQLVILPDDEAHGDKVTDSESKNLEFDPCIDTSEQEQKEELVSEISRTLQSEHHSRENACSDIPEDPVLGEERGDIKDPNLLNTVQEQFVTSEESNNIKPTHETRNSTISKIPSPQQENTLSEFNNRGANINESTYFSDEPAKCEEDATLFNINNHVVNDYTSPMPMVEEGQLNNERNTEASGVENPVTTEATNEDLNPTDSAMSENNNKKNELAQDKLEGSSDDNGLIKDDSKTNGKKISEDMKDSSLQKNKRDKVESEDENVSNNITEVQSNNSIKLDKFENHIGQVNNDVLDRMVQKDDEIKKDRQTNEENGTHKINDLQVPDNETNNRNSKFDNSEEIVKNIENRNESHESDPHIEHIQETPDSYSTLKEENNQDDKIIKEINSEASINLNNQNYEEKLSVEGENKIPAAEFANENHENYLVAEELNETSEPARFGNSECSKENLDVESIKHNTDENIGMIKDEEKLTEVQNEMVESIQEIQNVQNEDHFAFSNNPPASETPNLDEKSLEESSNDETDRHSNVQVQNGTEIFLDNPSSILEENTGSVQAAQDKLKEEEFSGNDHSLNTSEPTATSEKSSLSKIEIRSTENSNAESTQPDNIEPTISQSGEEKGINIQDENIIPAQVNHNEQNPSELPLNEHAHDSIQYIENSEESSPSKVEEEHLTESDDIYRNEEKTDHTLKNGFPTHNREVCESPTEEIREGASDKPLHQADLNSNPPIHDINDGGQSSQNSLPIDISCMDILTNGIATPTNSTDERGYQDPRFVSK